MQYLLDHLSATLVGLALIVILMVVQVRGQHSSAERTAVYAAKKHTLELADLLTRELSNIGAEMPDGQRIGKVSTNAYGLTDTLRFRYVNTAGDTLQIEYVLVPADTVILADTATVVYKMQRYQNGVLAGGSMATLRAFNIDLLDDFHVVVADTLLEQARKVRIRLASVLPYGDPEDFFLPEVYWGTTLRPQSLQE